MSMWRYVQNCSYITAEYESALSEEDVDELRRDLQELGEQAWLEWVHENEQVLIGFLAMVPSKLKKRKDWADPKLRRRIALAASHFGRLAGELLDKVERLGPGGGYRDTTAVAAHSAMAVVCSSRWTWPFGGEPPFPGWEPA